MKIKLMRHEKPSSVKRVKYWTRKLASVATRTKQKNADHRPIHRRNSR